MLIIGISSKQFLNFVFPVWSLLRKDYSQRSIHFIFHCQFFPALIFHDEVHRYFVVIQLLSHVWLFATPWTAARQASLSLAVSWNLLKFMSIELVMPSKHLVFCRPLCQNLGKHVCHNPGTMKTQHIERPCQRALAVGVVMVQPSGPPLFVGESPTPSASVTPNADNPHLYACTRAPC